MKGRTRGDEEERRRFLERKQISSRDPETPTDEAAEKELSRKYAR
jgi:hypothetical protein